MWSATGAIHKVLVCGVLRGYTQGAVRWSAKGAIHMILVCEVLRRLYTRCWWMEC